ncbi:hypothetical protein V6N12_012516 [Hibiscus sabdariffa]|uniref:Uncharacterized protein n=1 Tax=Hibiscus sabdariffa TaxID=183260 RepID=A0ABR2AQ36_9ROSI
MLSSMLGSSVASRLLAHQCPRPESYMQTVFMISSVSLLLPVVTNFLVAPSNVKGGSISYSGCIQLIGFCIFEACVGIFWPSIMKMRSQYIPEEARSTIMNFFRIPLNIFVCVALYNVNAFPHDGHVWHVFGFPFRGISAAEASDADRRDTQVK